MMGAAQAHVVTGALVRTPLSHARLLCTATPSMPMLRKRRAGSAIAILQAEMAVVLAQRSMKLKPMITGSTDAEAKPCSAAIRYGSHPRPDQRCACNLRLGDGSADERGTAGQRRSGAAEQRRSELADWRVSGSAG